MTKIVITQIQDPVQVDNERLRESAAYIRSKLDVAYSALVDAGKRLAEVKYYLAGCPGYFARWVRDEFGFSVDTANNYIKVAQNMGDLGLLGTHFHRRALYILSAPNTSPAARQAAIRMAENGDQVDADTATILKESPPAIRERYLDDELTKSQALGLAKSLQKAPIRVRDYCIAQGVSHSAVVDYLTEAYMDSIQTRNSANPRQTWDEIVDDDGVLNGIGWSTPLSQATESDIARFRTDRRTLHIARANEEKFDRFVGSGIIQNLDGKLFIELTGIDGLKAADNTPVKIDIKIERKYTCPQ